jgi:hypothetical protein
VKVYVDLVANGIISSADDGKVEKEVVYAVVKALYLIRRFFHFVRFITCFSFPISRMSRL